LSLCLDIANSVIVLFLYLVKLLLLLYDVFFFLAYVVVNKDEYIFAILSTGQCSKILRPRVQSKTRFETSK